MRRILSWFATLALRALAVFLAFTMVVGPVSADDVRCVNALMRNQERLVKALGKDISDCIRDRDKLLIDSAESCATSDPKGRVARATQRLIDQAVGGVRDQCGGMTPAIGYTDPYTAIAAAQQTVLDLAYQIFGEPLDLKQALGDPALTACRQTLSRGVTKLITTIFREYRLCVKSALQAGVSSQTELYEMCFAGPGAPDPKGRIAAVHQKLMNALHNHGCMEGSMMIGVRDDGARPTAVEYAQMVVLIIVVCILALMMLAEMTVGFQSIGANSDQADDGAVNNSHLVGMAADGYVANYSTSDRICINGGAGTFACGVADFGLAHLSTAVAPGLINLDTTPDVVAVGDTGATRICLNLGTATPCTAINIGTAVKDVAVGDLDNDFDLDAVIAASGAAYLCPNSGTGITSCTAIPGEAPQAGGVALGDVNGDKRLDIVLANRNQKNRFCINTGGAFVCGDLGTDELDSADVALGDVNADGLIDAVIANNFAPSQVCINDPPSFFCSNISADAVGTTGVAIADIDADGDKDVLLAIESGHPGGGRNRKCMNNGSATFTCSDVSTDVGYFQSVTVGDLDKNGTYDAVFGSASENKVCLNNGGAFTCGNMEAHSTLTNDIGLAKSLPTPPPTPTPLP